MGSILVIEGLLLALCAAVSFGLVDFTAALVSRRLGSRLTLALLMGTSVLVLLPIALVTRSVPSVDGVTIARFALYGAISAAAYVTLIQALRLGPLSVVGPITSSIGAATAFLAILLLGERPSGIHVVAIGFAVIGSVLAALVPGASLRTLRVAGPGVVFAVLNVIAAALVTLSIRDATGDHWAGPLLLLRASAGAWLLVLALAVGVLRGGITLEAIGWPPLRWISLGMLIGVLDTVGVATLALSLREAPAWVVGIVSGIAPAIVTVGGVAVLKERLGTVQLGGIAFLAASFMLLAVSAD